nr:hypothetical protein CFP56_30393 [Quercus suber]
MTTIVEGQASLAYLPLFSLRCFSSRSILRGFSATRFVLGFSSIALRATSRWPLQQLKPAEPSDVLVWLRELIQDLSHTRLAFNGSAMVSITRHARRNR